jgi:predicted DNA-binding transcriptional regulator YafY
VPSSESATGIVLSYGPHVLALEPDDLRTKVRERARAIAAQYETTGQNMP